MRPSILLLTLILTVSTLMFECDKNKNIYNSTRQQSYDPASTTAAPAVIPLVPQQHSPDLNIEELSARMTKATQDAAKVGATISVALLDRTTHQLITNNNVHPIATASVVKLFIADDLLMRMEQPILSPEDRTTVDTMLRSSDDGAAEKLWNQDGKDMIVTRVATRYGLKSTTPPVNGAWWNTITTTTDLVRYYDMLLTGAGGLPADRANIIIDDLTHFTPYGIDGYPQQFGIPDGLSKESVAVKQGWMCCIRSNWMHLSTGVIGADHRYVMAIDSLQQASDYVARMTITQAVKTLFPDGIL